VIERAILTIAMCLVTLTPSAWVLRARFSDISVYVDAGRLERARPDSTVGIWTRWVYDTATHASPSDTAFVKRIEVHSLVRCSQGRARALSLDIYGRDGTLVGHSELSATDDLHQEYDQMVHQILPAICPWLRDPSTPAIDAR
jgi:hypothetical protein